MCPYASLDPGEARPASERCRKLSSLVTEQLQIDCPQGPGHADIDISESSPPQLYRSARKRGMPLGAGLSTEWRLCCDALGADMDSAVFADFGARLEERRATSRGPRRAPVSGSKQRGATAELKLAPCRQVASDRFQVCGT